MAEDTLRTGQGGEEMRTSSPRLSRKARKDAVAVNEPSGGTLIIISLTHCGMTRECLYVRVCVCRNWIVERGTKWCSYISGGGHCVCVASYASSVFVLSPSL